MLPFTPPTDNLWKFVALTGIVVFCFAIYYPYHRYQELVLKKISSLISMNQCLIEGKYLKQDNNDFNTTLEDLKRQLKDKIAQGKIPAENPFNKLDRPIKELKEKAKAIELKTAEIEIRKMETDALSKEIEYFLRWGRRYQITGIILAIFGFVMWYLKTQRYQDKILKQQAKEYLQDKHGQLS